MTIKLQVGNLAPSATEQGLKALFARAGTVVSVRLLPAPQTGQPGGAHVTMAAQADAHKAISRFNGYEMAGRSLTVKQAGPPGPPAPQAGFQSKLNAFGLNNGGVKLSKRRPGESNGGYQSGLSAFGGGKGAPPVPPRRRRGNQAE